MFLNKFLGFSDLHSGTRYTEHKNTIKTFYETNFYI